MIESKPPRTKTVTIVTNLDTGRFSALTHLDRRKGRIPNQKPLPWSNNVNYARDLDIELEIARCIKSGVRQHLSRIPLRKTVRTLWRARQRVTAGTLASW